MYTHIHNAAYVVRCKTRNHLQEYLKEEGVQTVIHYPIPPHKQNAYKSMNGLSLPITESIHEEVLSIPISPVLENSEIDHIVRVLNKYTPS